jgi:3-deoxy-manno-octulosonate cytidylyltransferase (CMP-KDO synthetase)
MSGARIIAIIPARMASSRFPGKPLVPIAGLPMVEHVRRRTLLCRRLAEVVVATCDEAIADVIRGYGGRCVMTSSAHPGATDRVAEAARQLDCTHVINVQGDEVLVLPDDVERLARAIEEEPAVPAWNAVAPIEAAAELGDRSIVKCAVSRSNRMLFCARDMSALAPSLNSRCEPIRWVIGVLAYRRDVLLRYGGLARTPLEEAEAIDQSRLIEHDILLNAVEFRKAYPGVNEPRELALVERFLREDAAQSGILKEIVEAWPIPSSI